MKKTLIAAAIALPTASFMLPSSAFAQSSVTLYGVLDTNISYVNHVADGANRSSSKIAMGSGGEWGSRFGFRGTEDLGGGMKAIFVLEQGINTNDGSAATSSLAFGRLSYVGLESQYGTVTLGRMYSAQFDTIAQFFPQTRAPEYEPYAQTMSIYVNNAIKYDLRTHGFKIIASASLGGVAGNFRANAAYSGGVTYTYGPFAIAASADQTNTAANTVAPVGSVGKQLRFNTGVKYQLGKATLFAGYKWGRTDLASGVTMQRDAMYWTGVEYRATPSIVGVLGYYYQDLRLLNGANPANPQQVTLRGSYFLSKSTDLYAAVTHNWHSAINFAAVSTLAPGDSNQTGIAIGIRHLF
ncbi:porin [Robbsia sp. KACC 23696]|uniref:porin n=1 Tax=Robbsia sp. KACC 23696 TaxID=3149231 RepID=UPI00325A61E5